MNKSARRLRKSSGIEIYHGQYRAKSAFRLALVWRWLQCCLALVLCTAVRAAPVGLHADEFAYAEAYFETVGDGESISGGMVTALAQDAKGWLWIGTQAGLVRYDGYRFRKFAHADADPGSLAGDYVTALWAGADGKLWIGTQRDGFSLFDPETERFVNFRNDPARPDSVVGGAVRVLLGDGAGGVWIGTDLGLDHRLPGADAQAHHHHQKMNSAGGAGQVVNINSLLLDRRGALWAGTNDGLQRLTKGGKGFERIAADPADPASLAGKEIRSLFEAADGKLWFGTGRHGAAWLEPGTLKTHRLAAESSAAGKLVNGYVKAITQPRPDHIWLGTTGGGIQIVAADDGRELRQLRHEPALPSSLALDSVSAFLTDGSGLLWVGTWSGGLQRHNPRNQTFRILRHSPAQPASLSRSDIHSVLELADGRILAGTGGNGIDILDRRRGLLGGHRPRPGQAGALTDGTILTLAQTADGALWAGTHQAGVFRLAPATGDAADGGAWQGYAEAQGLPAGYVRKLLVTRDGTLWVTTDSGVARWLPAQRRFQAATLADGGSTGARFAALAEDAQGRLWVGSNAGLWLKEPGDAAQLQNIRHARQRPDSLGSDEVTGLLADSKGRLWVAGAKGLDRLQGWDGHTAVFEHIGALAARLGQDLGLNLLEDKRGRIWSEQFILDPKDMRVVELSKADGFDIGTAWEGAYGQTRDGLFLLGGTHGLAVIDPARFQPWDARPSVQASALKIDGAPTSLGALTPALELASGQRDFAIEFAALDYSAPQKNRYSYRLQGYDKDWIDTDVEHRSARYGNLWPGNYTLHVRGSNRLGDWSPHQLAIPIKIHPAFWQTAWFFGLALLALGGTLHSGFRWRVARLQARADALQKLVHERTADILAAHDKLASAHGALETAHGKLEEVYDELALAHRRTQETQQQMVLQEKMAGLGTLTAGVAHEINNPVNFAHVGAQNLRADIDKFQQFVAELIEADEAPEILASFNQRFAKLFAHAATIQSGTERIRGIVKDLRAFTRLGDAETKPMQISDCLNSTLNLVRGSWQEKVVFVTEFTDDPVIDCWPALLNQVFMNLLVNGCEAIAEKQKQTGSDRQGHLWLRLFVQGDKLIIEFEDDGIGIAPEIQDRVLEPFFTTKEVGAGTGLGLSTAYGIIQKHRGTLGIASTPGRGSCFAVGLPLNA